MRHKQTLPQNLFRQRPGGRLHPREVSRSQTTTPVALVEPGDRSITGATPWPTGKGSTALALHGAQAPSASFAWSLRPAAAFRGAVAEHSRGPRSGATIGPTDTKRSFGACGSRCGCHGPPPGSSRRGTDRGAGRGRRCRPDPPDPEAGLVSRTGRAQLLGLGIGKKGNPAIRRLAEVGRILE